jgi:class 3 adenylate cyclase
MFADIVGFTAWSSMREPTQVFTLLESIYGAFDEAARKRGVFKVRRGMCKVSPVRSVRANVFGSSKWIRSKQSGIATSLCVDYRSQGMIMPS